MIGPTHPFALAVRADLCMTLLGLERPDLAVDLAYDLADAAERAHGSRHPVTAHTQLQALFVLMCTREFDECFEFSRSLIFSCSPRPTQPTSTPSFRTPATSCSS